MSWRGIFATRAFPSNAVGGEYSIKTYPDSLIRKRTYLHPATLARDRAV
jgi:hypothetical protein